MNTDKRTDEELNHIIAAWCGWTVTKEAPTGAYDNRRLNDPTQVRTFTMGFFGFDDAESEMWKRAPNYCRDLNAVHEAELKTTGARFQEYYERLYRNACASTPHDDNVQYKRLWISATARQRAEALVKVIEEGKK